MSDIVLSPEYEALKSEIDKLNKDLTALIMERDELIYHICPGIESEYMLKIGALEYKAFEFQCKILRIKRKIELIQQKFNRQEAVVLPLIEEQLDNEYAEYEAKLKEKLNLINDALSYAQGEEMSAEDIKELKRIYRKIVKRLHPDMNPDITEAQHKLFLNAVAAYKNGDLKMLKSLEILIDEISDNFEDYSSIEPLENKKEALNKQIQSLIENIEKIKKAFPYNQKEFLLNDEKVKEKQAELNNLIEKYKEIYKHYEEKLSALLGN